MKIFNFITKQCLTLLCTAFITTQANASVCFLPDADNCGTNDIVTQCDGVHYFVANPPKGVTGQTCREKVQEYHGMNGPDGQPRLSYLTCTSAGDCDYMGCVYTGETDCKTNADRRSYKNAHYECYLDTATGCWYQTETPCSEKQEPANNPDFPLDSQDTTKACKSSTWAVKYYKCSDKGLPYTEDSTKTTWNCVTKHSVCRNCGAAYTLKSPIAGKSCTPCVPDRYETDYDNNWNKTGSCDTLYSCSDAPAANSCDGFIYNAAQKAEQEANGYTCTDCTPQTNTTNADGTISSVSGDKVFRCTKTVVEKCGSYTLTAAEKNEKEKQYYECSSCTPQTKNYVNGVEGPGTSDGATVWECHVPTCDGKKHASDCTGTQNFVGTPAKFPGTNETCGYCVDCADENKLPTTNACYGLHRCDGGREPEGETPCMCGQYKYYTTCTVIETCKYGEGEKYEANDGSCFDYSWSGIGSSSTYTTNIEKCTKVDGGKVYWTAYCTTKKDCTGNPGPAYGLKTCPNDEGVGTPVECGGEKWYTECNGCNYGEGEKYEANDGSCFDYEFLDTYTTSIEKCTKEDGSKVYWTAYCTTAKDCTGKPGLAYGLKQCASDEKATGDKVVHCGNYDWGTSCVKKVECSYDYDESMCKDNQEFVAKCHDNDGKWWGECKDKE